MKRSTRWSRLPWLLGLALLTGSLVGAGHVLHSRPTDSSGGGSRSEKSPPERQAYPASKGVYCHGTVDVESVYTNHALYPVQAGRVVEILTAESLSVHAGDILLSVDDKAFLEKVAEAMSGVNLADIDVRLARQGMERYQHLVAAQQAGVEAAQQQVRAAEAELSRTKELVNRDVGGNAHAVAGLEAKVNAAKALAKAEEEKLRDAQSNKPDLTVEKALESVELRKHQLMQAKAALSNCKLVAPADGTILRLNVVVGSVIGPQMQRPPIEFVPAEPRLVRATVEQEFANRVHLDQPAVIEDEVNSAITWHGKVKRLSDAYLPRRSAGNALSLSNGSETQYLEFLVDLNPSPNPPKLGQRVRVSLGTRN
jgi:multidrug resistance efflux pump